MNDPVSPSRQPAAPSLGAVPPSDPRSRRLLKWVLAGSLALNLVVFGIIGGATLRYAGHGPRPMMVRDLNFGPFTEALAPQDRMALRRAFVERSDGFVASREQVQAEFEPLLKALRASPFAPDDLSAAINEQRRRAEGRAGLGQKLLVEHLVAMTQSERIGFADRLERALQHGRERGSRVVND